MTTVRNGHWATRAGRVFPVRWLKGDRWREVRASTPGEPVPGPPVDLAFDDMDDVVHVATVGWVGGFEFEVSSASGDDVVIYAMSVPEEVRTLVGLRGDPHHGWTARVPADDVVDLHEVRRPGRSTSGGPR